MKKYVGTKQVQAEPMSKDGNEGYRVVYADGYESWSPKNVFENAYHQVGDFAKVFHAMSLNGVSPEAIDIMRKKHHDWIKSNFPDSEILSAFISDPTPEVKRKNLYCLGRGIAEYLSQADLLVIPHNWSEIRGVRCERYIAAQYGIPVVIMPDFDTEALK
jgi:hypothetical protein